MGKRCFSFKASERHGRDSTWLAPCLAHRHGGKGTSEDAQLPWQTLFWGNFCRGRCTDAGTEKLYFTTNIFSFFACSHILYFPCVLHLSKKQTLSKAGFCDAKAMSQTAVNHSTFPVPGAAGSPLCITSSPVATALGQLLSCCAPLWGCGDSDWILLHPIATFLPTCLYPFGTVLRREKPPSAPGRKKYKRNGQSWHHWVACCTERGSRTEMAKPKQCPKRCLPYGAVLGIGCVGIT